MTKFEFIKKVKGMKKPLMTETEGWFYFPSKRWCIWDRRDHKNKFYTPTTRITMDEYGLPTGQSDYIDRWKKAEKKYKKWFKEALETQAPQTERGSHE